GTYSNAYGISSDGSVVAGNASLANGEQHAFRWTEATEMVDLGTLGGTYSNAYRISSDGSVIAGEFDFGNDVSHAFRWTEASGMIDLGTLPSNSDNNYTSAYAVSSDGSVIVGESNNFAFRWTASPVLTWFPGNAGYTTKWASNNEPELAVGTEAAVELQVIGDYNEILAALPVQSVAGKSGNVLLDKNNVGLSNVDNTSDDDKPISTATAAALAGKVDINDHALSDPRTPTAHKTSHATGGTDALTAADIGAASIGLSAGLAIALG
ncbi:MAG: hypothetical protein ACKOPT_06685, partial [Cyanobium sp.]